jgi:peptidoglycan/xylan/chitin deacetylase (PgdA/CDA1 family)
MNPPVPTRYIAAYDTESPTCLEACRAIVEVHRKHRMPATFFLVGRTLEANAGEYRRLLDDPLFEIASHTWSHRMLRDNPFCGPAVSDVAIREEILRGKELVESVFQRPCLGLRPGCCFVDGLRGAPNVLQVVREAGLKYVSSQAWGPDFSLPAPLNQPFTYADDGFPELCELPCHGWHENLLKNNNRMGPRRLTLWPPLLPEAVPPGFITTPEEEVAINGVFLRKASAEKLRFVSLIWHPWSLWRFDPAMRMLDLMFTLVRELGLGCTTYAELWKEVAENR